MVFRYILFYIYVVQSIQCNSRDSIKTLESASITPNKSLIPDTSSSVGQEQSEKTNFSDNKNPKIIIEDVSPRNNSLDNLISNESSIGDDYMDRSRVSDIPKGLLININNKTPSPKSSIVIADNPRNISDGNLGKSVKNVENKEEKEHEILRNLGGHMMSSTLSNQNQISPLLPREAPTYIVSDRSSLDIRTDGILLNINQRSEELSANRSADQDSEFLSPKVYTTIKMIGGGLGDKNKSNESSVIKDLSDPGISEGFHTIIKSENILDNNWEEDGPLQSEMPMGVGETISNESEEFGEESDESLNFDSPMNIATGSNEDLLNIYEKDIHLKNNRTKDTLEFEMSGESPTITMMGGVIATGLPFAKNILDENISFPVGNQDNNIKNVDVLCFENEDRCVPNIQDLSEEKINQDLTIEAGESDVVYNFLAVGDTGGKDERPYTTSIAKNVAKHMEILARNYKIQYCLLMGDNFYENGVKRVDDSRFRTSFEDVYSGSLLNVTWLVIAGNHDHKGKVDAQIQYMSPNNNRWYFPKIYYKHVVKINGSKIDKAITIEFVMIDTSVLCKYKKSSKNKISKYLAYPYKDKQWKWIKETLKNSRAHHIIVAGHHPVYSVAKHGPTSCLVSKLEPLLYRYNVSLYISGHDHNLQHLINHDKNGRVMNYALFGSGSRLNKIYKQEDPDILLMEKYSKRIGGFGFIKVFSNKTLKVEYHDDRGSICHSFNVDAPHHFYLD